MGAAAAVAGGTVLSGIIGSQGAKSAASTQASAMDRAGERTAQAAAEAKAEIMDRMVPALADYNRGIRQSIDQIKQGSTNVIDILTRSTRGAQNILTQSGADAQKILMGSQAQQQGIPRQQFESEYRRIQQLPMDQQGAAFSSMSQKIQSGQPQFGYGAAAEALQRGGLQAGAQLERGFGQAREDIGTGMETAIGRLGAAQDLIDRREETALGEFSPYSEAGRAAIEQEAALSGAMGPEAQQAAIDSFIESPGQAWLREQQEKALLRSSAAIGGLGGGQVRSALQEQAMGRAATMQQQHLENLRSLAGRGQQAAGSRAQIMQDVTAMKTGLLSQDAQIRQQSAAQLAQLSQQLGMSQADLAQMDAAQISALAERGGINLAQMVGQQGQQQAMMEQGLGAQIAAQTGMTAADIARLTEAGAAQTLTGEQNIAQLLANLATGKGTNLANIAIGKGQAQAAGQQAQADIMGGMFQGLGNIAGYGIASKAAQPPPPQTTPFVAGGGGGGFANLYR